MASGPVEELKTPGQEYTRCPAIRVLAVVPGNGQGSSMIFVRRQIQCLSALGLEVRIFWLNSRTSVVELYREWRRLGREIRSFNPDLLHAHYGTVTSVLSAMRARVPLIITFRGADLNFEFEAGFLRSRIGHLLSQLSILPAQGVICVSRRLRERLWWRKNFVQVLPSGVNLDMFHPRPRVEARKLLGWEADQPTVVFHASDTPRTKGQELVETAIAHVEKRMGRIRLIILDGNLSPEVVPLYLNAADCLVLASENEGSPNIVKEALACNLPVVALDVGDVAERLYGVFPSAITSRDPVAFGDAIAQILALNRRSNGREIVACCSEKKMAEAVLLLYKTVVQKCPVC